MADDRSQNFNSDCPSDETLTLWGGGLLSGQERAKVDAHVKSCAACRDLLQTILQVQQQAEDQRVELPVPQALISSARQIIKESWEDQIATIFLKLSKGVYSAVETTGRILLAPWMDLGVTLRSDSSVASGVVVIETIYRDMRCVVESRRTQSECHTLTAVFTHQQTNQPIDPMLFVLFEDREEIESQMSSHGKVVFEDLPPGAYRLTMKLPDGSQGHLNFHLISSH